MFEDRLKEKNGGNNIKTIKKLTDKFYLSNKSLNKQTNKLSNKQK